jgi:hypothetical protein
MKFYSKCLAVGLVFVSSLCFAQRPTPTNEPSLIQNINMEKNDIALVMVSSKDAKDYDEAQKMFTEMKKNVSLMHCIEMTPEIAKQNGLNVSKDKTLFAFVDIDGSRVYKSVNIGNIDDLRDLMDAGG